MIDERTVRFVIQLWLEMGIFHFCLHLTGVMSLIVLAITLVSVALRKNSGDTRAQMRQLSVFGSALFVTLASWLTLLLESAGKHRAASLAVGVVASAAAAWLITVFLHKLSAARAAGNGAGVGGTASVCSRLGLNEENAGTVKINVHGSFVIKKAISDETLPIETGTLVQITAAQNGVLVCRTADAEEFVGE
ncbi:MAG: hypothetical protein QM689_02990 [Oscillospiraceae bacterium]